MKHFKQYDSYDAFQKAHDTTKPLIASMPDGGGRIVVFRTSDGSEKALSSGAAQFRYGMSIIGGQAKVGG